MNYGELAFWCVLLWCGGMAFRWWGNNVRPTWTQGEEEAKEVLQFASYKNKDTTFSDYEYQPFSLDHDPRPAA